MPITGKAFLYGLTRKLLQLVLPKRCKKFQKSTRFLSSTSVYNLQNTLKNVSGRYEPARKPHRENNYMRARKSTLKCLQAI